MDEKEILKGYFTPEEIKTLEEKKPDKYAELLEKLKSLGSKTKVELDKLKQELDSLTLDQKIDRILSDDKSPVAVNETTKEEAVEAEKQKAISKLREKAEKKYPFIGGAVFDLANDLMKSSENKDAGLFDKIFGKIGASIGIAVLGFLGLKKGYEELNEKKDDETKEDIEGKDNIKKNEDIKYILGVKSLNMLKADEKNKDNTVSILAQKEIKEKSFSQLEEIYKKGKIGIANNLGLEGRGSDEDIYNSIKLIIDNEKTINSIFIKINPNWKGLALVDIMSEIGSKGVIIDNLNNRIKKLDLSLNPVTAFSQISKNGLLNGLSKNEFGDFEERKHLLKPLNKESIFKLILSPDKLKTTPNKELKERLYNYVETPEEKATIDKILKFSQDIIPGLSNIFPEKNKEYIGFFNENGISIKDAIELYMITGGETNINTLDGMSKSLVYLKLGDMLGDKPKFRGENFDKILLDKISKNELPDDVKNILGTIFSTVSSSIVDGFVSAGKEIWGALTPAQIATIGVILGVVIAGMVYLAPIALAGAVIGGLIITAVITGIIMSGNSGLNEKQVEKKVNEILKQQFHG